MSQEKYDLQFQIEFLRQVHHTLHGLMFHGLNGDISLPKTHAPSPDFVKLTDCEGMRLANFVMTLKESPIYFEAVEESEDSFVMHLNYKDHRYQLLDEDTGLLSTDLITVLKRAAGQSKLH